MDPWILEDSDDDGDGESLPADGPRVQGSGQAAEIQRKAFLHMLGLRIGDVLQPLDHEIDAQHAIRVVVRGLRFGAGELQCRGRPALLALGSRTPFSSGSRTGASVCTSSGTVRPRGTCTAPCAGSFSGTPS